MSREELPKQQKQVLRKFDQTMIEAIENVGENVDEQIVELHKIEQSQAEKLRQHESMQFDDDEHHRFQQEIRSFEHHGSHNSASDFPKSRSTNSSQFCGGPEILASSGEI